MGDAPAATFRLNADRTVSIGAPGETLLTILREELSLTGTKRGCDIGRCGACLVLIDGAAMNACLISGFQLAGRRVTTIEGLRDDPAFAPLFAALIRHNAFQCGYCAPGFVIALAGLAHTERARLRDIDEDEILAALEGNICRCTGYRSIVRGARAALADLAHAHAARSAPGERDGQPS